MNRRTFLKGIFSATAVAVAVPGSLMTKQALSKARYTVIAFTEVEHKDWFKTPTTKATRKEFWDVLNTNLELYEKSFLDPKEREAFVKPVKDKPNRREFFKP